MNDYNSILTRLSQLQEDAQKKNLKTWLSNNERIIKAVSEKEVPYHDVSELLSALDQILNEELKAGKLRSFYSRFMMFVAKKYAYVPPKHYTNQWMAVGMAAFGLPFGVIFALAIDNLAFMSIGLPLGLPIGLAIGAAKDKKAQEEGKVLNM